MDFKRLSEAVLEGCGGRVNVISATHCMTRLRLVLQDSTRSDPERVRKIPGVLGVSCTGGQFQVIIGTNVKKVYTELSMLLDLAATGGMEIAETVPADSGPLSHENLFNRFFKVITGIIFPVIGSLTAAGITKGLLAAGTSFHLLEKTGGTYRILYAFADGFFYFLPIILAISAARYFKSNPYVAATIGAALVYPDMVSAFNDGTVLSFVHIPVILSGYANSIFPIMLASFVAARIEYWLEPRLPDSIAKFTSPLIVLVITVPLTFLIIGPVMTGLSDVLASFTTWIYRLSPVASGIILGAFWQLIVIFGLHYAFIPVLINNITTMGHDPVNAILNVTVFALSGAAIGFALRAKKKDNRILGFSTGMTGLLGITEPIIYSIALPYKRPFICAFIGGAIGGGITAGMGAAMYSFGANAIFAAPMFINPEGIDHSFTAYLIASTAGFIVSLILSYFFSVKKGQSI